MVAEFAKAYAPEFESWIKRVAKRDPARAAELYLRALEYHIPKLNRTHISTARGTLEELVMGTLGNPPPVSDLRPAIEAEPVPATTYQRVGTDEPATPAPLPVTSETAPTEGKQEQLAGYRAALWDQINGNPPARALTDTDYDPFKDT